MADIREEIELFTLGKLSGSALEAFEARLAANPDFAAEVAREAELIRAIRLAPELDALQGQLEGIDSTGTPYNKTATATPLHILFATAATIILLVVAIWFFNRMSSLPPHELFVMHFQPPKEMSVPKTGRGTNDTVQTLITPFYTLLALAEQDYNNGNPTAALAKISRLQSMTESRDYADLLAYYAGLACLQTGKPEQAVREFEKIAEDYPTEKPWYVALARLEARQMVEAKAGFKQIAGSKSPYSKDAAAILEQLK